ncbi:FHA domain-containing protein [Nocardioides sp. MAH-18]|uniref:FHA domain-containing protein n=1 Tax=Nocardioides agri TaxID=2682843 RepID=A0A6L6XPN8_9ACTN|nr:MULTISPECIES: FHA domain-containing protein [unclassified Nocardioides]MBA2954383.1 FHA domain-containing protein [Nocardioides sp. CGMCC 1.13656]MVQ49244.1 FHA domain-containing protein [Nocardioides sp. MAH-18]
MTAPAWSFRPGGWYAVIGPHATVALPSSERARVAALWELVDGGAGFDETLDALVSAGLRDLDGFVLVSVDGDTTRVVIRGPARAHLAVGDDVVLVEGVEGTTWVERSLHGVTRIRIEVDEEVDEEADGVDGLVETGLVRVATAEHPPARVEPESEPEVPQATQLVRPEHDGLTRPPEVDPLELLRPRAPGIAGQEQAPPVTAQPVARLVFDDGETVAVDRAVLVGRAPQPARSSTDGAPRLVTVPSPHHEVSSTHLEIRPGSGADHGAAVVTDLGSTNGTVVVQPGLPPEDLRPGVAVQLVPGSLVDLGDGVNIRVVSP